MLHSLARRFRRVRASRCLPVYSFLLYANNNKITPSECHEKPPRGPPPAPLRGFAGGWGQVQGGSGEALPSRSQGQHFPSDFREQSGGVLPEHPGRQMGAHPPAPQTHTSHFLSPEGRAEGKEEAGTSGLAFGSGFFVLFLLRQLSDFFFYFYFYFFSYEYCNF